MDLREGIPADPDSAVDFPFPHAKMIPNNHPRHAIALVWVHFTPSSTHNILRSTRCGRAAPLPHGVTSGIIPASNLPESVS